MGRTLARTLFESPPGASRVRVGLWLAGAVAGLAAAGCGSGSRAPIAPAQRAPLKAAQPAASRPLALILAPHHGTGRVDQEIRRTQQQLRDGRGPAATLEQLGWLFVAKARSSHDPGFYKLAEYCALALEAGEPADSSAALLLRGHVLQSLHRFKAAEQLARRLVAQRGLPYDFGLLGDTLQEQGRIDDAVEAYQRFVDLRPGLQSYSRVAHVRWLKGDVEGALEVARLAASAGSPHDPDTAAWAWGRVGFYSWHAGRLADAEAACNTALEFVPDFPDALLLRGRLLLAKSRYQEAIEPLRRAASQTRLPDFQWSLAEALAAAGDHAAAAAVEAEIRQRGAVLDPRTLALFLATRGQQMDLALRLAAAELEVREDVFTHDAMAWALAANDRCQDAWPHVRKALAAGTSHARLFLHAGAIAKKLGRHPDARQWLDRARDGQLALLPSEVRLLTSLQTAPIETAAEPEAQAESLSRTESANHQTALIEDS